LKSESELIKGRSSKREIREINPNMRLVASSSFKKVTIFLFFSLAKMNSSALTVRADDSTSNSALINYRGWENADFPIVCESMCLAVGLALSNFVFS
jgi:hypothetical protein